MASPTPESEGGSDAEDAKGVLSDAEDAARERIGQAEGKAREAIGAAAEQASIDLLNTAGGLTSALDRLTDSLESLKKDVTKRSRSFAIAIAFDVLLTIALSFFGATAISAQNRADTNVATQIAACQATNDARKNTRDFWDKTVIPAIEPTNPTPAQVEAAKAFQVKVDSTYSPRDCSTIQ